MMNTAIVGLVDFCARRRWIVIVAGLLLLLGTATYAVARFSINTDIEGLISEKLPWHERQLQLTRAFPQRGISAVVSAPTAENAEIATNELSRALAKNPRLFPKVVQPEPIRHLIASERQSQVISNLHSFIPRRPTALRFPKAEIAERESSIPSDPR